MCLGLRQSLSRDQEQSSWLGRWDLYLGSRVCAPVWEEPGAGARGVGSTAWPHRVFLCFCASGCVLEGLSWQDLDVFD